MTSIDYSGVELRIAGHVRDSIKYGDLVAFGKELDTARISTRGRMISIDGHVIAVDSFYCDEPVEVWRNPVPKYFLPDEVKFPTPGKRQRRRK